MKDKIGNTVEVAVESKEVRKSGNYHFALEIPDNLLLGYGSSDRPDHTRIELSLPIGGELNLSSIREQLEEDMTHTEIDVLLEKISLLIEEEMVLKSLKKYLRFDHQ